MPRHFLSNFKEFLLDFFFPKTCFGCGAEGSYLCSDCLSTMDILNSLFCLCPRPKIIPFPGKCPLCRSRSLAGLYFAVSYKNVLAQKLIYSFKYSPFVREIAESLAWLIITHFKLAEKEKELANSILIPVPLGKRKLRERGYNQSEEITKILSGKWGLPLVANCLEKIKATKSQMELSGSEREQNLKGAFAVKNAGQILGKKILLVDDVYTTGATLEECAKVLKQAGSSQVWGIVVGRG